ncbi:trehalase-like [Penaeus indicus]|uniref:trehalase-like n=1 Tax=Penaeus indicus TaxID=29960 RepID=UPI00300D7DFF
MTLSGLERIENGVPPGHPRGPRMTRGPSCIQDAVEDRCTSRAPASVPCRFFNWMFGTVAMERRRAWSWQRTQVAAAMVLALLAGAASSQSLPPPCDSEIYCHGNLLHTVQMARLYNDSKHFVDMSLKASPNDTLRAFQDLMDETGNKPSKEQVKAFVNENFNEPGSEFVKWTPPDWNANPEFLDKVVDPDLEKWGRKLNELWKDLGRKISDDVERNPEKYSQIFVPNPVIVPGGRFREFYYWDSYWTIDGLLLTGMEETVKGMLDNFIQMVSAYGMVPNGGRVYYTRRSQPPYLIPMVKLYMDQTNDLEFLRTHIDQLVEEFEFWENERSVEVQGRSGRTYKVAQYRAEVGEPRPESYREDYELAHNLRSEEAKEQLYVELKSGAESGWDYSTRWFINNNTNKVYVVVFVLEPGLVPGTRLPRDMRRIMAQSTVGVFMIALYFVCPFLVHGKYSLLIVMLLALGLWEMSSTPTDMDCKLDSHAPLIVDSQLDGSHVTGVPTSLVESGEQWDFPNAWAPLQHLVIMGLYNARSIHHEAENLSLSLAEKWIRTNWEGYQQSKPNAMFEKYNVSIIGLPGGGGEYDVQLGFGWTNGVALRLLEVFSDRLTATTGGSSHPKGASFGIMILIALLPLSLQTFIHAFP